MKRGVAGIIVRLLFVMMVGTAHPLEPKNSFSSDSLETKRVCSVLKESATRGEEIKKVVKTSIEMGYNACAVIKCAVSGGGSLPHIVRGAVEAGVTPDVISRCAVDAGASAEAVGRCLVDAGTTSLCYFQPAVPGDELISIEPGPPIMPASGRVVSPSSF